MAKIVIKKRKWKFLNILLVLLFFVGVVFGVYFLLQVPVKNIVILNTTYLEDDTILEWAEIKDYPKFFLTFSKDVGKKLEKSSYIRKASLHKKWYFLFELEIEEARALFWDNNQNKFVLEEGVFVEEDAINHSFRVPRLLNYVPDTKYQKFISSMNLVKEDVLSKISDIEYQPNDYDKDRFLLYMDDGNMVYLTLTKFKMINHYNEVLEQLDSHKGILYLDNGNHFQIKE